MSVYITRQQRAVLKCMAESGQSCTTAADLAQQLRRRGESVGLSTVYRQLERLAQQGLVHKVDTDAGACYHYCDAQTHGRACILLKCEKCGAIEHMDCSHLEPLYRHMEEEHHFHINPRRTLFYGLCRNCAGEAES